MGSNLENESPMKALVVKLSFYVFSVLSSFPMANLVSQISLMTGRRSLVFLIMQPTGDLRRSRFDFFS